MITYAKCTIGVYQQGEIHIFPNSEFRLKLVAKIQEMVDAGKTDGKDYVYSSYQIKRVWLNQAAAEEWVNFVEATKTEYNVVGHSLLITDNVDDPTLPVFEVPAVLPTS